MTPGSDRGTTTWKELLCLWCNCAPRKAAGLQNTASQVPGEGEGDARWSRQQINICPMGKKHLQGKVSLSFSEPLNLPFPSWGQWYKPLKSVSAAEAFWKVLCAPPAEPLHPNTCASSSPPAPRAHARLTETLHAGCSPPTNAPGHILPKIRAVFPQVCQPHKVVMKRQINHKYFILSSVHLCSHPFYKKTVSLRFVAVSSLESSQTPVHHHTVQSLLILPFPVNSSLGHTCLQWELILFPLHNFLKCPIKEATRTAKRSISLVSLFCTAVITYME